MDGYTSDARWALSQVEVLRRREQVGQEVGTALHELAEACETAAQIGRVVDRHLRLVIEEVRKVDGKASVLPATTQQDQVDNVALRARLAAVQADLVATRPFIEQAVVRLGWASDYARQAVGGPGPDAQLLVVDQVESRLTGVAEVSVKLRQHLTQARDDIDRARGLADAICGAASVRMDSHRDRDHSPAAREGRTTPGIGL
ncbi:hypothetical protein MWU75_07120 [Ornithinimicrobium sp. F0845]|uniref:hypothetical protein n=1 Tax=Ornithinimicrobium sp. F0845 TaxID=2926412 RepID=UPI001FF21F05|nr:hypothetical protein [Ornithinimicrobium sp. F0845]MCK0111905.1 hypothetical protein [Ornithinimicrobium sp. F0845]